MPHPWRRASRQQTSRDPAPSGSPSSSRPWRPHLPLLRMSSSSASSFFARAGCSAEWRGGGASGRRRPLLSCCCSVSGGSEESRRRWRSVSSSSLSRAGQQRPQPSVGPTRRIAESWEPARLGGWEAVRFFSGWLPGPRCGGISAIPILEDRVADAGADSLTIDLRRVPAAQGT
ncbi:hypothetical protein C2845_PM03G01850 [Panicum miliaceum]|uniref:Uncharacterized protein n=1 Tax=Panicum miliaceum TaxID=4540 RepID=A0A3L6TEP6_PANMI|nr:hypothetical protein C2845_PM03G01850 [Panicum miliaceum]